jgi:Spy/CpxP family protein refolding chaperone
MGGPGAGLHIPPPEAFERLGLSEAQRTKLEALRDGERRRSIRADAELRLAEMDLVELVESETPDTAAIDAAIARLMAMRTGQLKARAEVIVAMRAVLTSAQRAKLRRPDRDARWH